MILDQHFAYLSLSVTSYRGGVGGYHSSSLCSLSSSSRMMMLLDLLFLRLDLIVLDSALRDVRVSLLQVVVKLSESQESVWTPSLSSWLRINMSLMYLGCPDPVSHHHRLTWHTGGQDGQGTTEIFKVCCLWLGQPPPPPGTTPA